MSRAKHETKDNRKNPEYHVATVIRKLPTDTNRPTGKPWPNHVKNDHHKIKYWKNIMMQMAAN